jgi:hypothetical protein
MMKKYSLQKCGFFIGILSLFSCASEITCDEGPELDIDQTRLEAEIDQIENYLEAEGIDYQTHSSGIRYSADYEGKVLGEQEAFGSGIGAQFSMRSSELIPGIKIAVSLMNRNADYRFYIPAQLLINKGISNSVPASIPADENIDLRIRLTSY